MFVPEPEIGTQSKEAIKAFQETRLGEILSYVNKNSKFYSTLFKEKGIDVSQIKTIEDLEKLPVTTKEHLQQQNMDFLCVDKSKIIDYMTTSGTSGEPVTFGATENDLERLALNEYMSFVCAGGSPNDIYHLIVTLDRRFMAGLAYYIGLRKLGASIVRVGPGNPELQFDTIKRIKPTVFVTVPSFLIKMIEYAEENNIDYKNSSIKSAICIGEPIRDTNFNLNKLGQQITSKWDIQLFSTYASTEMSGAFTECTEGKGGHLHAELMIVEFLDSNNKPVKEGELGEVTITTLGVEGMPLIRFKTGDICTYDSSPCKCGRNTLRISPVVGRKNQMIKYKGTSLFPPSLYDILNDMPGVKNYIIEVSTNSIDTDDILVKVGCETPDEIFEKNIKDHFRAKLRVAPSIQFLNPDEIAILQFPGMSRKPVTFIDKRISKY